MFAEHMKAKPSSVSAAKKKKGATTGVTAIIKTAKKALTGPIDTTEKPGARGDHGSPSRGEIRKTTHRVMGSRQSQKPVERSNQARKKRG